MKLVLYSHGGVQTANAGLLVDEGVIPLGDLQPPGIDGQTVMKAVIDSFEMLRGPLEALAKSGQPLPLTDVKLLPPLPRPGKIIACISNYWEHAQREARPLNMFLKNPDAVIGPGDIIRLPEFEEPWCFMHEAELALVIRGPAKRVAQADWRSAVFGYTCGVDVTARGQGRATWKMGSWLGKSFDTFAPLGPCIVTADEVPDPNDLVVQLWNNDELRHNYNTDDMEHRVPEIIEFATTVMTLNSGDVIFTGTNHEGLGFLQDGEQVRIRIQHIGEMELSVADPLKRTWERGIYAGVDSTNHDAIRRHRPDLADKLLPSG